MKTFVHAEKPRLSYLGRVPEWYEVEGEIEGWLLCKLAMMYSVVQERTA